jgi:hypothetical protein
MAPTDTEEWTVARHLSACPPAVVALYGRFVELVEDCGPFTCAVARTAITLKGSRRGFAGILPGPRHLGGYLDLRRHATRPVPYAKRLHVHRFRITELSQLDEAFAGLLHEAYAVGHGAHLVRTGAPTARELLG